MTSLLQTLFGSSSSAGVLAFLATYQRGYASEIARYINADLFAVQNQLSKFERAGLLTSRTEGRTRIYTFNPEHPLRPELIRLIEKSFILQTKPERATPLPRALRAFFWDYRFDQLTWVADRELVTRRLLTHGSWEAITWLRRKMGDGELRKWLIAHRGRGLSPRQLRFWSLVLAIPHRQVKTWVQTERTNPWSGR
jgi:DNA-binding transcriptional ArsR family regulator